MSQKRLFLDAAADRIFGAAADCRPTYLGNFLLAHDSRDYCAHLGAFKLKIYWLGNKLWSFEIKVLKVHQTSGKALITTRGSEEWIRTTPVTGGGRTGPSGTLLTGSTTSQSAMDGMWCFIMVAGDGSTLMIQANVTTSVSLFNKYMNMNVTW